MRRDPIDDFVEWDEGNYEWLKKRPDCCLCGQPITDEYGYKIQNDWFCEDCMNREFRTWIDEEGGE